MTKKPLNKRLFLTWFVSYILILLVPITLGLAMFGYINNTIEDEIDRSTTLLLDQTQNIMDTVIKNSMSAISRILVSPETISLLNIYNPDKSSPLLNYYLLEDLRIYHNMNAYLNEIVIYFHRQDTLLSSVSGAMTPQTYYEIAIDENDMTMDDLNNILISRYNGEIRILNIHNSPKIGFMQTVPSATSKTLQANIILLYNENVLNDVVKKNSILSQGMLVIKENYIPIYSTDKVLFEKMSDKFYDDYYDTSYTKMEIDDIEYIVSEIASTKEGRSYAIVVPSSIFFERSDTIRMILYIGLSICFVLGALAALGLARRQYRPIKKIVDTISRGNTQQDNRGENELTFINNAIYEYLAHEKDMEKLIDTQKTMIHTVLLNRMLRGEIEIERRNIDYLSEYDLDFPHKGFAVVRLHIEEMADTINSNIENETIDDNKTSFTIVRDIFKELFDEDMIGYITILDNQPTCLINYPVDDDFLPVRLDEMITSVQNLIHERYNIDFSTGISGFEHQGLKSVAIACEEATYALEYRLVLGKNEILYFDDVKNPRRYYQYSIKEQQQLIAFIDEGDYQSANQLMTKITDANMHVKNRLSIEMIRCLSNDLIATMIKSLSADNDISFIERLQPALRLSKARAEGKNIPCELDSILREVCKYRATQIDTQSHTDFSESIKHFIQDNYTQSDLNISMLGDEFNLTPTYLSRLFKEHTGEYLLDYINKIRIDKATQMLKETAFNINDIATKCGYTNANSFIRVFKKFEGITPGSYRRIVH